MDVQRLININSKTKYQVYELIEGETLIKHAEAKGEGEDRERGETVLEEEKRVGESSGEGREMGKEKDKGKQRKVRDKKRDVYRDRQRELFNDNKYVYLSHS